MDLLWPWLETMAILSDEEIAEGMRENAKGRNREFSRYIICMRRQGGEKR